jgi:hypothetical protein
MYLSSPNISSNKFHNQFQRQFRCKYKSYLKLLRLITDEPLFQRWLQRDAAGRMPSPRELMHLGALRHIGRGWTFDNLEEATSISDKCQRQLLCIHLLGQYIFIQQLCFSIIYNG